MIFVLITEFYNSRRPFENSSLPKARYPVHYFSHMEKMLFFSQSYNNMIVNLDSSHFN